MAGRQIPREDRPLDATDRWWQRNVDPLVARLRREYPHLFPDADDGVARATDERYTGPTESAVPSGHKGP